MVCTLDPQGHREPTQGFTGAVGHMGITRLPTTIQGASTRISSWRPRVKALRARSRTPRFPQAPLVSPRAREDSHRSSRLLLAWCDREKSPSWTKDLQQTRVYQARNQGGRGLADRWKWVWASPPELCDGQLQASPGRSPSGHRRHPEGRAWSSV